MLGEPFTFDSGAATWDLALVFMDTCQLDYKPIKVFLPPQAMNETSDKGHLVAGTLMNRPVSVIGWGDTEGQCVR